MTQLAQKCNKNAVFTFIKGSGGKNMNYHQGRNSGPNLDGGEKIRGPMNFVHPCIPSPTSIFILAKFKLEY